LLIIIVSISICFKVSVENYRSQFCNAGKEGLIKVTVINRCTYAI